jgi:hypothetical protein
MAQSATGRKEALHRACAPLPFAFAYHPGSSLLFRRAASPDPGFHLTGYGHAPCLACRRWSGAPAWLAGVDGAGCVAAAAAGEVPDIRQAGRRPRRSL